MGRQQLIIAGVVILAVVAGIALWLTHSTKHKKHHPTGNNSFTAIGPKALNKVELSAEALAIGEPVYWAGPMPGFHYEFWRLKNDNIYVRYLPKGVKAGAPGKSYLIISRYPFPQAYKRLKKQAHNKGVTGPGGSFIWPRPGYPKSVYIAWPKVPYEIEVYDPHPSKAITVAESGQVKTVG